MQSAESENAAGGVVTAAYLATLHLTVQISRFARLALRLMAAPQDNALLAAVLDQGMNLSAARDAAADGMGKITDQLTRLRGSEGVRFGDRQQFVAASAHHACLIVGTALELHVHHLRSAQTWIERGSVLRLLYEDLAEFDWHRAQMLQPLQFEKASLAAQPEHATATDPIPIDARIRDGTGIRQGILNYLRHFSRTTPRKLSDVARRAGSSPGVLRTHSRALQGSGLIIKKNNEFLLTSRGWAALPAHMRDPAD